jgi:hypothetical protein
MRAKCQRTGIANRGEKDENKKRWFAIRRRFLSIPILGGAGVNKMLSRLWMWQTYE